MRRQTVCSTPANSIRYRIARAIYISLAPRYTRARDVRFAMWVSMLGMWGCRVVAGYTLGIVLGMGVVGVWLGMFLDWAVRGALFYWRLVSGRWLWRYPRVKRE
ncbi:MATE family multidrug exporter [Salmonella enterica subsp. enterica serovar Cerro str. FSL R8-0235]|nr:MATE family multidrug exporter [Salmonella enterica subsp. enterica serovar Cerro str. FSL R8-0235]